MLKLVAFDWLPKGPYSPKFTKAIYYKFVWINSIPKQLTGHVWDATSMYVLYLSRGRLEKHYVGRHLQ